MILTARYRYARRRRNQPRGLTTMTQPIWAVAVTEDKSTALLVICPADASSHAQMLTRVRAAGAARVTPHEFIASTWPHSRTMAADIVAGELIRVTTGKSSFYTGRADAPAFMVTPAWQDAAFGRGRIMFGVVPPGTMGGGDGEGIEQLAQAVESGTLIGCSAVARFDLPIRRPQ